MKIQLMQKKEAANWYRNMKLNDRAFSFNRCQIFYFALNEYDITY